MGDSEAVKAWRDRFKLNCSLGRKYDIDATVTDVNLWRCVLNNWGYKNKAGKWIKFNPLAIGHQLSEYERLERKKNPRWPEPSSITLAHADHSTSADQR